MNKWIKKAIIGSVLISIIIPTIGYFCYIHKKNISKVELQEVINNRYLEGKDEIGAYFFDLDTIRLDKVKDFNISDNLSWLNVSSSGIWNSLTFSNVDKIKEIMNSTEYEWYNFKLDRFSPFMIIVKKTDRGYDIIGEYITGVGLKHNFPKHLIRETSQIMDFGTLDSLFYGKKSGPKKLYNYSITTSLSFEYIDYLTRDKYKGLLIRDEITLDENGFKKNNKLELLEQLVMKSVVPANESLYFRTNRYFELRYDDNYTYMGSQPIQWSTSSYGNYTQQLFTRTVTLHYSIQENEGILKREYFNLFSVIYGGGIILYLLMIFGFYKNGGAHKT